MTDVPGSLYAKQQSETLAGESLWAWICREGMTLRMFKTMLAVAAREDVIREKLKEDPLLDVPAEAHRLAMN